MGILYSDHKRVFYLFNNVLINLLNRSINLKLSQAYRFKLK